MRTGSLLEVSAVLKGLLLLNQSKPLSFREKKMLERARYLLVSELAMAKNCDDVMIEEMPAKALSMSKLRFPEAPEFVTEAPLPPPSPPRTPPATPCS